MLGKGTGGQAGGRTEAARGERIAEGFLKAVRRIAGMPDYDAHIEHLARCHPEHPLPTRRQFYEDFVRSRYESGVTRCC